MIFLLTLNHHLYYELSHLTLGPDFHTVHLVRSKLPLIVASLILQLYSNNYNGKSAIGIGIKPTKNINLTSFNQKIVGAKLRVISVSRRDQELRR